MVALKKQDVLRLLGKRKLVITFCFFWNEQNHRNNTVLDEYGAIPSGAVTEEIYNQYKIGDTYCVD